MIILVILIGILFLLSITFNTIFTIDRYENHQKNPHDLDIVNLTFNQFEKIFNINPRRWFLDIRWPNSSALDLEHDIYEEFKKNSHAFYYNGDNFVNYRIIFNSFFDYVKFEKWLKRYEKEGECVQKIKNETQRNKNLENMLESVKKDIDKLQKEANEEIKKSLISNL